MTVEDYYNLIPVVKRDHPFYEYYQTGWDIPYIDVIRIYPQWNVYIFSPNNNQFARYYAVSNYNYIVKLPNDQLSDSHMNIMILDANCDNIIIITYISYEDEEHTCILLHKTPDTTNYTVKWTLSLPIIRRAILITPEICLLYGQNKNDIICWYVNMQTGAVVKTCTRNISTNEKLILHIMDKVLHGKTERSIKFFDLYMNYIGSVKNDPNRPYDDGHVIDS
jgi:hypothetical protein